MRGTDNSLEKNKRHKKALQEVLKTSYLAARKFILSPFLSLRSTKKPTGGQIKKILFLRCDGVGDMVLSTPAFKALKNKYPSAVLTVLASERNCEVIRDDPYVDKILLYKGIRWFIKEMRSSDFDLAIDPFLTYKIKYAFMAYLSGAKYRMGFEESGREIFFNVKGPAFSYKKNMVQNISDLVEPIVVGKGPWEPEIFLADEEKEWAFNTLSARKLDDSVRVAIHPGAFYPIREWPAERFREVVKRITEENRWKVLVFGGKKEEAVMDTIHKVAGGKTGIFYGLGLRQFMSLLSCCDLLICNNSGPLHIASALGIPTVSIVGPSIVPLWLPYGENHIVIRKDLPCSPCNRVECKDHSCMKLITVEEVMEAVKKQLGMGK